MPFILIKNYLKLMLRNKWILLMMIICPLLTVALLSNAFRDMMDTIHKVEDFQVGYRVSEGSIYKEMLPQLKTVCEENGMNLLEFQNGDIDQLMKDKTVAVFVDISDNSCTIYQSGDKKTEAAIVESNVPVHSPAHPNRTVRSVGWTAPPAVALKHGPSDNPGPWRTQQRRRASGVTVG
jgi:ABC-2 type transport system permease protein